MGNMHLKLSIYKIINTANILIAVVFLQEGSMKLKQTTSICSS